MFKYLFFLILLSWSNLAYCQEVNFSQFNTIAPYYNPAFSSAFTGNYRVSALHRNQWIGFQDQPISSFCILGDIKFDFGLQNFKSDYFGASVYFITDRAQQFDWNNNEVSILLAYHKLLDKSNSQYLSLGIGLGITQRSINYDNLYFEDQFDGLSKYNGSTSELLPPNIFSKPSIKIGIQHQVNLKSNFKIQSGLALHHVFRPDVSFYKDFDNIDYIGNKSLKSDFKITGIVNGNYKINNFTDLYPKVLVSAQGAHLLTNIGFSIRRSFYNLNQTAIHTGINTRIIKNLNAIIPADLGFLVGFEIKGFLIGMHYDFGIRDALKYASPTNSVEISLSLIGNYDNEGFICPTF
ncbi:MAG TPA: PorP/SprF family type IX secretion system membrane protein [Saprospiraceae bacterium]|nr:PorP/SprF family type IX secretion system membrane protein [Saprospiraceae bacterium]